MIGVNYDLFWTLNPKSLSPFIKAFSLKQKYDDSIAWKHGLYVRMAIASSLGKNVKYPNKPFMDDSTERVMTPQEIKERMLRQMKLVNSRFEKEVMDEQ